MRNLICIALLLSCSSVKGNDELVDFINLCEQKYTSLGEEVVQKKNVYVLYSDKKSEKFNLMFTSGEVGTFGKRSPTYRMYYSCAIIEGKVALVSYKKGDVYFRPERDLNYYNVNFHDAFEEMFFMSGDSIEFKGRQKYDVEKVLKGLE